MRAARFSALPLLAIACSEPAPKPSAPVNVAASAPAMVSAPRPTSHCLPGGPESEVRARVAEGRSRVEIAVNAPLHDAMRVCELVVAEILKEGGDKRVDRLCDAAPLPKDGRTWLERVDWRGTRVFSTSRGDDCEVPFPTAFSLAVRSQSGPFPDEAQCMADEASKGQLSQAAKAKDDVAKADAALQEIAARYAKTCPAAGKNECHRIELERERRTGLRDQARVVAAPLELTRCVAL